MIKIMVVFICVGIAAALLVKSGVVWTAGTSQARTPSIVLEAEPSIDPHALMRNAPYDLPLESWNAI